MNQCTLHVFLASSPLFLPPLLSLSSLFLPSLLFPFFPSRPIFFPSLSFLFSPFYCSLFTGCSSSFRFLSFLQISFSLLLNVSSLPFLYIFSVRFSFSSSFHAFNHHQLLSLPSLPISLFYYFLFPPNVSFLSYMFPLPPLLPPLPAPSLPLPLYIISSFLIHRHFITPLFILLQRQTGGLE